MTFTKKTDQNYLAGLFKGDNGLYLSAQIFGLVPFHKMSGTRMREHRLTTLLKLTISKLIQFVFFIHLNRMK